MQGICQLASNDPGFDLFFQTSRVLVWKLWMEHQLGLFSLIIRALSVCSEKLWKRRCVSAQIFNRRVRWLQWTSLALLVLVSFRKVSGERLFFFFWTQLGHIMVEGDCTNYRYQFLDRNAWPVSTDQELLLTVVEILICGAATIAPAAFAPLGSLSRSISSVSTAGSLNGRPFKRKRFMPKYHSKFIQLIWVQHMICFTFLGDGKK